MINIYVAVTCYNLKVINDLIDTIDKVSDTNKRHIVISQVVNCKNDDYIDKLKAKADIIHIHPIHTKMGIMKELLLGHIKKINSVICREQPIRLFIPHYSEMLSNYLVNYKLKHLNPQVYIYEDGTILFLDKLPMSDYLNLLKSEIKAKIIMKFAGLDYRITGPNVINPYNEVKGIYTYEPKLVGNFNTPIHRINYFTIDVNIDDFKAILILGDAGWVAYKDSNFKKLLNTINYLLSKESLEIFYKFHPGHNSDNLYNMLSRYIKDIKVANTYELAEELVLKLGAKYIIAPYMSTAIFGIERIYKGKIKSFVLNTTKMDRIFFSKASKIYKNIEAI